jgi:DNA replication protein DnaC
LLTHPTLDLLHQLGLNGMAKAFGEIEASAETTTLTHPEWLGLLLDQEVSYRRDRRLLARLRYARLRHQASVEDIDYRAARGLDRALFQKLAACGWIDAHENLILCGPTGIGKSWLASALGHKACRDNRSVLYQRIPKLFADLALARGDGRYARCCGRLAVCSCSSSMIGVLSRSMLLPATTSSKSSKNATVGDRRSSPAKSRSTNGTS